MHQKNVVSTIPKMEIKGRIHQHESNCNQLEVDSTCNQTHFSYLPTRINFDCWSKKNQMVDFCSNFDRPISANQTKIKFSLSIWASWKLLEQRCEADTTGYTRGGQTFHTKDQIWKNCWSRGPHADWKSRWRPFFLFSCRSQSTYECALQNRRFSPPFSFQLCTVEAYFFKNHCHSWSLKEKKGLPLNSWWKFKFP